MNLTRIQHALLFSILILTSSLAGCFGSDGESTDVSAYENDIAERDQEIENLESVIANLTMNVSSLVNESEESELEITSLEEQYSILLEQYNQSLLNSENLSRQLIYCEVIFGDEIPDCYDAQGWYSEYLIREQVEENISIALATIQEMESLVVHMSGANLSGAFLYGADLSDAVIINSNLSGADLRWALLTNSNLSGSDLSYAQLDSVDFGYGANLTNVSFRGVDLRGVLLSQFNYLNGVNFSNSILGSFEWMYFNNSNFSGANFFFADILGGSYNNSDFTYSDMLKTVGNGQYFENSDLTGATNAVPYNSYWVNTICPDGTNSDDNGNTCEGHEI